MVDLWGGDTELLFIVLAATLRLDSGSHLALV